MPKELNYNSSIKDMPLMFPEMKRTAMFMYEGKTSNEILRLSLEENVYQFDKERRRRDVPNRMIKRLSLINKSLLDVIANGNIEEAKLIAFFAMMKADRLLFEFMYEVYSDKHTTGINEITDKDYMDFIERKIQNSETVAKWTSGNISSVRSTIKFVVCETGLAKKNGDILLIQRPITDNALLSLFDESDRVYAKAMLMEV